jgi:hypothetical protein
MKKEGEIMSPITSISPIPSEQDGAVANIDTARRGPNRRDVLRLLAAGSLTALGGTALVACGEASKSGSVTNVTLQASGAWPVNSMPTKADRSKDPFTNAYGDWLQGWLKKNPGVTIKATSANIWDAKALSTSISAGTAATWFLASVLGGDDAGTRAAFARGLAADTTDLFSQYRPQMALADYADQTWRSQWNLAGHYYGAPGDYFPGRGVYYRKDLLKAAGLPEPQVGWTWQDLRTLAKALTTGKRKGIVFQSTALSYLLSTYQFNALTMLPANSGSNWHWKYDYTSKADEWQQLVDLYRGMVFDDKSVLQDVNYAETDAEKAFFRGDVAMAEMHSSFYTHPAQGDPAAPSALAAQLKMPMDQVVGYVIDPVAPNKSFGATQGALGVISFDPHLNKASLDKAFNLYSSFWLIDGVIKCNQASYKAVPTTANALSIYQAVTPTNKNNSNIPGIPGDSRKYWGDDVVGALLQGTKVPIIPNYSQFVPAEEIAGPPVAAYTDAMTKLAFSQQNVKTVLQELQSIRNQQAASLNSNASQDDFNKGAKQYYQSLAQFWQQNAPDFYSSEYQPWYQTNVVPVLGS